MDTYIANLQYNNRRTREIANLEARKTLQGARKQYQNKHLFADFKDSDKYK